MRQPVSKDSIIGIIYKTLIIRDIDITKNKSANVGQRTETKHILRRDNSGTRAGNHIKGVGYN